MPPDDRKSIEQIHRLCEQYKKYLDSQPWMRRYTDLVQEKQRILKDLQAAQGVSEVRDILERPTQVGATKRPITQAEVLSRFICTWKHILGYTALVIFFPVAVPFSMLWSWRAYKTICFWKPKGGFFVKKVNALCQDDNQFSASETATVTEQDIEELNTENVSCNHAAMSSKNNLQVQDPTASQQNLGAMLLDPHTRVYSIDLANGGSETINTDDCAGPGEVPWEDTSYLEEDPREWIHRDRIKPISQSPETGWVVRSYNFYQVPDDPIGFRMAVQFWGLHNTKASPIYSKRLELSILDYPHVSGYRPEKIVDKHPNTFLLKNHDPYIHQTKRIPINFEPDQALPLLVTGTDGCSTQPLLAIEGPEFFNEDKQEAAQPNSFLQTMGQIYTHVRTQGLMEVFNNAVCRKQPPPVLQGQKRFEALCEKLKTESFMHYASYWDELVALALPSTENRIYLLRQTLEHMWKIKDANTVNLFSYLYQLAPNAIERVNVIECCVNLVEEETICLRFPSNYSEKRYVAWNNYLVKWFLEHLPDNYNEDISISAQIYSKRLNDVKNLLLEGDIHAAWQTFSDPPGLENEIYKNHFLSHAFPGIQARYYMYKHIVFGLTGHVQPNKIKEEKEKQSFHRKYFLMQLDDDLTYIKDKLFYFGTDKLYKPEYWEKTEKELIKPLKFFCKTSYENPCLDSYEKHFIGSLASEEKLIWERWLEKEKNIFKDRYDKKCKRGEIISYRAPSSALYANDFLMSLCAAWIGNENEMVLNNKIAKDIKPNFKKLKIIAGNDHEGLIEILKIHYLVMANKFFNVNAGFSPLIYKENLWKSNPDIANHLDYFINNHVRKWMFEEVVQDPVFYEPFFEDLNFQKNNKELEEWKWGWRSMPKLEAFIFARKMGFCIEFCRDDEDFSVIKSYLPLFINHETSTLKIVEKRMHYGTDYYPVKELGLKKHHGSQFIRGLCRRRMQENEKISVPSRNLHKRSRSADRIKNDQKFIGDALMYDHINGNGFLNTCPVLIPYEQKDSFWLAICICLLLPTLYSFEKGGEKTKSFNNFLQALSVLFPENIKDFYASAFFFLKDYIFLEEKIISKDILHGISFIKKMLHTDLEIHSNSYMHLLIQEEMTFIEKYNIFSKKIDDMIENERSINPVLIQAWCDSINISLKIYADFQKKNLLAVYEPIHENIRLEISIAFIKGTFWSLLPKNNTKIKEEINTRRIYELYKEKKLNKENFFEISQSLPLTNKLRKRSKSA